MGTKHWVTNRLKDLVTGKYILTYNNTSGQIFQNGTTYPFPLETFPDEPNSVDCVTVYSNAALTTPFTKNDCTGHSHGSVVNYTVPAGKYTSTISQANADAFAVSDTNTNGQLYANANGTCIPDTVYYNVKASGIYTKNDCGSGTSGTAVEYVVPANTYSSYVSQADADAQATADITANGQTYANSHGTCIITSKKGTFLIDFYDDEAADVCFYCTTPGVAEANNPVTARVNNGGTGINQYPNDGRDPATAVLISSDRLLLSSRVKMRFGVNMAYLIANYPSIDHHTFIMKGRTSLANVGASSGVYALRDISEGYLALVPASGEPSKLIPTVVGAGTTTTPYSTHTTSSGADGTTGTGIGANILQIDYVVSTNVLTITTF